MVSAFVQLKATQNFCLSSEYQKLGHDFEVLQYLHKSPSQLLCLWVVYSEQCSLVRI